MNVKQKVGLVWLAGPIGAYLASSRGPIFAVFAAGACSYLAYLAVFSKAERDGIQETIETIGMTSNFVEAVERLV